MKSKMEREEKSDKRVKRNRAAEDPERVMELRNALATEGTVKAACRKIGMDKDTAHKIFEKNPLIYTEGLTDNRRILEMAKEMVAARWLKLSENALIELEKRLADEPEKISIGLLNMIAGTGWDKAHNASRAVEEKQVQMSLKAVQELFKTAEELGREIERRSLKTVIEVETEGKA